MKKEPLYGVKKDGRGQHNVVPLTDFRKQAFLDWLCTPKQDREEKTFKGFAEQLGVERKTLQNWRDDKEFLEEWERRYLKTIGDPSRKQSIMDALYKTATDPDDPKHVTAAGKYFEIEGSMKPQKSVIEVRGSAKQLSDAELNELIASKAQAEKESREAS